MKKRLGFTLVETVIALVVLAIVAALALPKLISVVEEARRASEKKIIGDVREGVGLYNSQSVAQQRTPRYPLVLDNASNTAASNTNAFFTNVLAAPGVYDSKWTKADTTVYETPIGDFYAYDPNTGIIDGCSSSTIIGSTGQTYTFIPSQSADPATPGNWADSHGGLYSPWAGDALDFQFNFGAGGNFMFNISAINNANHPDFTAQLGQPERTDWHLPSFDIYPNFLVDVYIDGNRVSHNLAITASDTEINSSSFMSNVSAGAHTVSFVWLNDYYDPLAKIDANMQFQNITVQSQ